MTDLPAPLTPPDCDLKAFSFMPLHVARLRDSDLAALEDPEACWYAVLLWCASWHQVPAASLTDDDAVLARLCGLGRDVETFRRHKAGALRGFIKCSDGRLYHPIVAEQALESWGKRETYTEERSANAERQARWRADMKAMCAHLRNALGVTPPLRASKTQLRELLQRHDPAWLERYDQTQHERYDRNARPEHEPAKGPENSEKPENERNADRNAQPNVTHVTGVTANKETVIDSNRQDSLPKPESQTSARAHEREAGRRSPMLVQAMEAAGMTGEPPPDWNECISRWRKSGYRFELDVLPAIRSATEEVAARGGRKPFRFKFFDDAIRAKVATDRAEIERLEAAAERVRSLDRQQQERNQRDDADEARWQAERQAAANS